MIILLSYPTDGKVVCRPQAITHVDNTNGYRVVVAGEAYPISEAEYDRLASWLQGGGL